MVMLPFFGSITTSRAEDRAVLSTLANHFTDHDIYR